jgi:hypothetical protein
MKPVKLVLITILAFAVVACGKKGDPAEVQTNGVASAPVYPIGTNPFPWPTTDTDLPSFCRNFQGQISNNICRIERVYSNSSWLNFNSQWGRLTLPFGVYYGERVIVTVTGNPRVYVNSTQYGEGSISFLSYSNGYLSFERYSSTYSVTQVRVQTCFNSPHQRTLCN